MPLSYTWGKDHPKSLISSLLWLQSSRAAQFVDQIPILVQENHLPHSFLKMDALKSLAKITACSCCSLHREAHIFTSFSYRGSLFPPCPWCSGLLRDWRNCPTWGGEGRALEIQLFHNPLHSVVSCSALKCGRIMLCLILPENSVASVYSKLCLAFTNDIWVDASRLKITRACLPFWCYWKASVRQCLWVLCFNKIFTNCSPGWAQALERFTPVKTPNLSESFSVARYPTKQHLCVLSQSFTGVRWCEKNVKPNPITSSLGATWISAGQNLTPQSSVSPKGRTVIPVLLSLNWFWSHCLL